MAERTVHDCDRCGKQGIQPVTVYVQTGRSADPCEGSTIDSQRVDLCPKCAEICLKEFLKTFRTFEEGAAWYKKNRHANRTA